MMWVFRFTHERKSNRTTAVHFSGGCGKRHGPHFPRHASRAHNGPTASVDRRPKQRANIVKSFWLVHADEASTVSKLNSFHARVHPQTRRLFETRHECVCVFPTTPITYWLWSCGKASQTLVRRKNQVTVEPRLSHKSVHSSST